MKKLILLTAVLSGVMITTSSFGQVSVGVNVNIGTQPLWGPVGYDHVDYYYMPDIDVYYNVPQRQYVYMNSGRWCYATSLPARYRNYDIYRGYKVVINEPRPFLRNDYYREHFRDYRGWYGRQPILRDRRGGWDRGRDDHHDRGRGHGRGHWDRH